MDEWQPIETTPKDGAEALLAYEPHDEQRPRFVVVKWFPDLGAWLDCETYEVEPTHWMPLPSPPLRSGGSR